MSQFHENDSIFNESHYFAILIDADNISAKYVEGILSEVARYGVASIKRIYGDWTTTNTNSWKETLLPHAIQPIQQFAYIKGKNATDSAMIIDAMDLLYTQPYLHGFCLISSDSDFTRLASRLREAGKIVYGLGEKKTPQPFRSACNHFIYVENLSNTNDTEIETKNEDIQISTPVTAKTNKITTTSVNEKAKSENKQKIDTALINLIRDAINAASDEDGWGHLGGIGSYIKRVRNDFDSRSYGYTKLIELIRATNKFEILAKNKQITIKDKSETKTIKASTTKTSAPASSKAHKKITAKEIKLALNAFNECSEDGKASLGNMHKLMKQNDPNFNFKIYGYGRSSTFMKAINIFVVDTSTNPATVTLKNPAKGQ